MKLIITAPNVTLIKPAQSVYQIDKAVKQVVRNLQDVLSKADHPIGVGLAASQIGISLRIFLIKPKDSDPVRVFINPEFISKSQNFVKGIEGNRLEGCLSIPKVWGIVKRHKSVKLRYLDESANIREEVFTGFPAIIIQHEMDHLDGILFTRRVLEQKGTLYKPGIDNEGKEVLEPIEI